MIILDSSAPAAPAVGHPRLHRIVDSRDEPPVGGDVMICPGVLRLEDPAPAPPPAPRTPS